MPTRKQRRRQAKEKRHEYEFVYVDDEGNELDDVPEELEHEPKRREPARNGAVPVFRTILDLVARWRADGVTDGEAAAVVAGEADRAEQLVDERARGGLPHHCSPQTDIPRRINVLTTV